MTEEIVKLPPSAKLVLKVLTMLGQAEFEVLQAETMLPTRTLREAIRILRERDLVSVKPCIQDLRKKIYCIKLNPYNQYYEREI
jgi:transcription initiation factor IIE alpha subunit